MAKYTSRFIAAHIILLVAHFQWIDAAPGKNGSPPPYQPIPAPFSHMGVTTVCVELRPAPHSGSPQQICGPIVPSSYPAEDQAQQEPPPSSPSRSASPSSSEFEQSPHMQQLQQQKMITPLPEFMMRSEPQPQQQHQALMEQPCAESQHLYGQRFLDMVPPPAGFFAHPPPSPYMAKAADGRTFFLAPWGLDQHQPSPMTPEHFQNEQRAAFDCDSLKTNNGIRGFPPRVFNSRTLPLGPPGFMAPPMRQIPFQTPQNIRSAPSMGELMKEAEAKDKIIAAKSDEIAKLQRELNLSSQTLKQSSSSNVSSMKVQSSQMSQSTEKSDGIRAVVSNAGDQQAAASTSADSAASLSMTADLSDREKTVKRQAPVDPKK